jgi:hypothetical protein
MFSSMLLDGPCEADETSTRSSPPPRWRTAALDGAEDDRHLRRVLEMVLAAIVAAVADRVGRLAADAAPRLNPFHFHEIPPSSDWPAAPRPDPRLAEPSFAFCRNSRVAPKAHQHGRAGGGGGKTRATPLPIAARARPSGRAAPSRSPPRRRRARYGLKDRWRRLEKVAEMGFLAEGPV